VPDVQDFDYFIRVTVHHHIRRADDLAGSFYLRGGQRQLFNAVYNGLSDIASSGRIVFLDVLNRGYKLVGCLRRPPTRLTNETACRYG
jgi:hypothetical protein